MSKILPIDWSGNFTMDDEHESERMKDETIELASPISFLNLGSEKMPMEKYVQWRERKLLMHSTTWLNWWNWHGVEKSIQVNE